VSLQLNPQFFYLITPESDGPDFSRVYVEEKADDENLGRLMKTKSNGA
jgi:hypothetical protein